MLKKLMNFFIEEDIEKEVDVEKEKLKKELNEERKMYESKAKKEIESAQLIEEPVKKQVLFVDEDFERKTNVTNSTSTSTNVKYNNSEEKKFKPSQFISPVHGLVKDSDEVIEYVSESKTTVEKDYSKIRSKVFGEEVAEVEMEDTSQFKIFKTSEIVDLKKRLQVDNTTSKNENVSIEEAYSRSSNDDEYFDSKSIVDTDNSTQDLFDLLDELSGEDI